MFKADAYLQMLLQHFTDWFIRPIDLSETDVIG